MTRLRRTILVAALLLALAAVCGSVAEAFRAAASAVAPSNLVAAMILQLAGLACGLGAAVACVGITRPFDPMRRVAAADAAARE